MSGVGRASRAWRSSVAELNRRSGLFSRQRRMIQESLRERSGVRDLGSGGGVSRCSRSTAAALRYLDLERAYWVQWSRSNGTCR